MRTIVLIALTLIVAALAQPSTASLEDYFWLVSQVEQPSLNSRAAEACCGCQCPMCGAGPKTEPAAPRVEPRGTQAKPDGKPAEVKPDNKPVQSGNPWNF